jgi:MFS family permease
MESYNMVQEIVSPASGFDNAPAGIWVGANRRLTAGLVLTIVGAAFEALAVATTLPATIRDLGGLELYGWAFSAFMLTNLIGITVAGAQADRLGPARPYAIGAGLFVVGLFIAGLAPSMEVLIGGRVVQGLGAGFISSVAYVAIGRAYAESERPRMLAVTSSAWVVPGLIGPALAGVIADHAGWRWVFLGLAPLMLIAAVLALPALRRLAIAPGDAVAQPGGRRVYLSAIQLAAGAGMALAGLGFAGGEGAGAAAYATAAALVGVGLVLAVPALRQLLPAGTLRAAPGLPATIAATGLLNLAFFGADAFVPLALTQVRGQSATVAGIALTAATITWSSGAWVQAHLAARGWRRGLVLIGLALIAVGIAGVTAVLLPDVPIVVAPLAWGVAGLGMGFAYSTIALVVLERAEKGQEGTATAAMQLANGLATALGAGVGGAIVAATSTGGIAAPAGLAMQNALMIGVIVLAVVAAWRLAGRQ